MSQQFESSFHGAKEAELFYQLWKAKDPKFTFIITHGLAEHSECYSELAIKLSQGPCDVVAWDLRGHGRSEGKRGFVEEFEDLEYDLYKLIEHLQNSEILDQKNFVLFGHSLGGLVTTKSYIRYKFESVKALVLSAPAFGIGIDVPTWKRKMALFGEKWLPKLTLWNEIDYADLTSDEQKIKSYAKDPLRHDRISPGLFLGMINGFPYIEEHEQEITIPTLVQLAGNEKIVSSSAGIRFYEGIGSEKKELHIYQDSLHEIYNDRENEDVIKDLLKFINQINKD